MIRPLDIATQLGLLLEAYPDAICYLSGGDLHWHGTLQPDEHCRRYRVHVIHRAGGPIPECYVIDPTPRQLVQESRMPDRPVPHVYRAAGDPLCLFFGEREWNGSMPMARTTIPWISLWLRFFEIWLVTDTWEGGGVQHVAAHA